MDVFIGVDGGGTKTVVTAVDANGKEVGSGRDGCTNPNSIGNEAASKNLKAAIFQAIDHAKTASQGSAVNVKSITLSLSGVDRPHDVTMVTGWVKEYLPESIIRVENDAVAALASGTEGTLRGIVLISGTGMIVYGRNSEGEIVRAGGWGCLTDRGSGYNIGIHILEAVWDAHDGSGPHTSLEGRVKDKLQLQKTEDLIGWTYSDLAFHRIAGLAVLAFEEADNKDEVAISIIKQAARDLAKSVITVARRLKYKRDGAAAKEQVFPLVLAGSVSQSPLMKSELVQLLSNDLPNADVVIPSVSASLGAALLALNTAKQGSSGTKH